MTYLHQQKAVLLLVGSEMWAVIDVLLALDGSSVSLPHSDFGGGEHGLAGKDRIHDIKD